MPAWKKNDFCQTETPEMAGRAFQMGGAYVRTVKILVLITKVIITIGVGDETLVIEIPIVA
jgi:hypothetical protein